MRRTYWHGHKCFIKLVSICHFVPPKNKPFYTLPETLVRLCGVNVENTPIMHSRRFDDDSRCTNVGACANIRVGLTILPYFPFSSTELKIVLAEGSQVIKSNSNLPRFQLYRIVINVILNTVTNVVNNPNICHVEYSIYFLEKKLYRMFPINVGEM